MEMITLGSSGLKVSRLALGCMHLGGGWNDNPVGPGDETQAQELLETAMELGINCIDHADIYTFGKAEEVFGRLFRSNPGLRAKLVIQSKVGIRIGGRPGVSVGHYDLSPEWIRTGVEASLRRLGIDHLDVLLLHRPDPLMEPEELAKVLGELKSSGKVGAFGVSNMHSGHLRLLQGAIPGGIVVNQLQASLHHRDFVESGVTFNHASRPQALWMAEGTIEVCRAQNIALQAWSPLAGGVYSQDQGQDGVPQDAINLVRTLADKYKVSREAIVLAWLLRHPARWCPVLGTSKSDRLRACAQATTITLERQDWNALLVAARGERLP